MRLMVQDENSCLLSRVSTSPTEDKLTLPQASVGCTKCLGEPRGNWGSLTLVPGLKLADLSGTKGGRGVPVQAD